MHFFLFSEVLLHILSNTKRKKYIFSGKYNVLLVPGICIFSFHSLPFAAIKKLCCCHSKFRDVLQREQPAFSVFIIFS